MNAQSLEQKDKVLRILNGPFNGCEFNITTGKTLIVMGSSSVEPSAETITELPYDTIYIPNNDNGTNFEIIIKDDEEEITICELQKDDVKIYTILQNQKFHIGDLTFAIKNDTESWNPEVLGIKSSTIQNTFASLIHTKKWAKIILAVLVITGAIVTYNHIFQSDKESYEREMNSILKSKNHDFTMTRGRDETLYILAMNLYDKIWVDQIIARGEYNSAVSIIYPADEMLKVQAWLSKNYPGLRLYTIQLDEKFVPELIISDQANNLSEGQWAAMRDNLMDEMPYAKNIELVQINDDVILHLADEKLKTLGVKYRRVKTKDYISYLIEGEINDTELILLEHFITDFYHKWGNELIRFHVSLSDDYLKDKTFGYGGLDFIKETPEQWVFINK